MSSRTDPVECSHPRCRETYAPHAWGATKAHNSGWFQQKNGDNWCPKHIPKWVVKWRARKKEAT